MLRLSSKTICSDPSVFDEGLPCGALVEPFGVGSRPASEFTALGNVIHRCIHCSAVQNRFCFVEASGVGGGWVCSFCNGSNDSPSVNLESLGPVMDYEEQSSPSFREPHLMTGPYREGLMGGNGGACVWVVDGTLPSTSLLALSRNFKALCADRYLPVRRWGLVVFTGVVSVYRLARGGAALAEVLPGDCFPGDDIVNKVLGDSVGSFFMEGCGSNVNAELPLVHVLSVLAKRRGGVGDGYGPWKQKGQNQAKRCLGAAVKCALELMRISGQEGGRLIVCLSGAPNVGPGAMTSCAPGAMVEDAGENVLADTQDTYHGLSQAAVLQETCIDVLCADYGYLGAQSLETLVHGCGGYVLPLRNFGDQFHRTAEILLSTQRPVASEVHLELRVSQGWVLGDVVGPVWLAESTMEEPGTSSTPRRRSRSTSVVTHHLAMGKADSLVGIALYIHRQSKDIDPPPPSCTVQVVARWREENGNLLIRSLTVSAGVGNVSNFVSGLDIDVVSALLAKRIILSSLNRGNGETEKQTLAFGRSMVDDAMRSVYQVAHEHGKGRPGEVLPLKIPSQLWRIQQRLFHLWRGPLLGHMVSNADERYLHAELLLKGCLKATLGLIGPSLYVVDPLDAKNSANLVQSETLCLLPDRLLLVDTWDVVYIWVGSEVDACNEAKSARITSMELAEEMCRKDTRLPAALIQVVEAGDPWARFVTTRLEPSHKDAPRPGEHSKISHIRRLLCEQMNTDDLSFNAYVMKICQ